MLLQSAIYDISASNYCMTTQVLVFKHYQMLLQSAIYDISASNYCMTTQVLVFKHYQTSNRSKQYFGIHRHSEAFTSNIFSVPHTKYYIYTHTPETCIINHPYNPLYFLAMHTTHPDNRNYIQQLQIHCTNTQTIIIAQLKHKMHKQ